jgi:hypothetical protein
LPRLLQRLLLRSGLSEGLPFKIGEQLNYQVFIGTTIRRSVSRLFRCAAVTLLRTRWCVFDRYCTNDRRGRALFVARDQIDSYVDPKALLPYRTVMNLS